MIKDLSRNKAIVNVQAFYPEDKEIVSIINICKLYHEKTNWKIWSDGFGNALDIDKLKIIDDNRLHYPDLYYKASPQQIVSISNVWMVAENNETIYVWFLGKDNRLRFLIKNDKWINSVPLLSGLSTLRMFVRNVDVEEDPLSLSIEIDGQSVNAIIERWPSKIRSVLITELKGK